LFRGGRLNRLRRMDFKEDAHRNLPELRSVLGGLQGESGRCFTYILKLRSGRYYTGCTSELETRLKEHINGTACHTTRFDPPEALLWIEIQPDFRAARAREAQIKKWSRAKKEALIAGDRARLREASRSRE